jgi:hypothetical protein
VAQKHDDGFAVLRNHVCQCHAIATGRGERQRANFGGVHVNTVDACHTRSRLHQPLRRLRQLHTPLSALDQSLGLSYDPQRGRVLLSSQLVLYKLLSPVGRTWGEVPLGEVALMGELRLPRRARDLEAITLLWLCCSASLPPHTGADDLRAESGTKARAVR